MVESRLRFGKPDLRGGKQALDRGDPVQPGAGNFAVPDLATSSLDLDVDQVVRDDRVRQKGNKAGLRFVEAVLGKSFDHVGPTDAEAVLQIERRDERTAPQSNVLDLVRS